MKLELRTPAKPGNIVTLPITKSGGPGDGIHPVVEAYLRLLGIKTPVVKSAAEVLSTLPAAFKSVHAPEWNAFISLYKLDMGSESKSILYSVLEFARYMKHLGLNPYARAIRVPLELGGSSTSKLDTEGVCESVIGHAFTGVLSGFILPLLRKARLFESLAVSSTRTEVTQVVGSTKYYTLKVDLELKPLKKGASVAQILRSLEGYLFKGSTPLPLQHKYKAVLRRAGSTPGLPPLPPKCVTPLKSALLARSGFIGWFLLRKTDGFVVQLALTREDSLLIRISLLVKPDVSLGHKAKAVILKRWKSSSKLLSKYCKVSR